MLCLLKSGREKSSYNQPRERYVIQHMLTNYNLQLLTYVCTSQLFLITVCMKVKGKWILLLSSKALGLYRAWRKIMNIYPGKLTLLAESEVKQTLTYMAKVVLMRKKSAFSGNLTPSLQIMAGLTQRVLQRSVCRTVRICCPFCFNSQYENRGFKRVISKFKVDIDI